MKNIIRALTILFSFQSWAQSGMNPCNRNISTNPANPFNDEWPSELPNTTEHFTNTGFNWVPSGFAGSATIRIDKTQHWATPYAAQSGFISMLIPIYISNAV